MAVDESSRHLLYEQAARALGTEAADVLMNHLPPAGWSDLARRGDVEHETALLRSDMAAMGHQLRAEMAELRTELKDEIAGVRTELKSEIAGVRIELKDEIAGVRTELKDEIAGVRSELTTSIGGLGTRLETVRADLMAGMAAQTRWMIGVITVLAVVFTTVTVLAG